MNNLALNGFFFFGEKKETEWGDAIIYMADSKISSPLDVFTSFFKCVLHNAPHEMKDEKEVSTRNPPPPSP